MYLSPWKFFRNQILLDYLGQWRNQSCQIFFQSVHPGVSGKGSNFAIFSANRRWPLQLLYYRTTVIKGFGPDVKVTSLETKFLTEECKCINWNVAANVSLGTSALFKQIRFQSLFENRLREGFLKSSGRLFQRAGPEVAKIRGPIVSFLFYYESKLNDAQLMVEFLKMLSFIVHDKTQNFSFKNCSSRAVHATTSSESYVLPTIIGFIIVSIFQYLLSSSVFL